MNFPKVESIQHPFILRVTISVFHGSQRMCYSFDGIDDGTAEIISRIDLPGIACSVMGLWVAAIDDWIPHGFVRIVYRNFSPDAPLNAFLCALLHLLKMREILLDTSIATSASYANHSLFTHRELIGIVCICHPFFEHPQTVLIEFFEIIACIADFVRLDSHPCQILNNSILELLFLLGWICVIESTYHRAFVLLMCEIVVQQCCLCVTDV